MLSWFIGKRYVATKHGTGASVTSAISIISIMIGTAVLIISLSVMNGVTSEVRDKILSMTAHAKIINGIEGFKPDQDITQEITDSKKSVIAEAPYVMGQALVGQGQSYSGVQVKGVDPKQEASVTDVLAQSPDELATLKKGSFNIIIGKGLADNLGLNVGDKLTLVVPKTTVSAAGILPRIKQFTISGIFESGHYLFDSGMVFVNISDAQILFQRKGRYDGYQLKLKDPSDAPNYAKELNTKPNHQYFIYDWSFENKAYFDSTKAEKVMIFIILMCILVVAYINILSTLFMTVSDKRGDIAILRTLGMQQKQVVVIFMIQGVILGLIGTVLGFLLGYLVSDNMPTIMQWVHNLTGFSLPPQMYFISELPAKMDPTTIFAILGSSFLLSILAPLYPAYKASKVQPARALAYE